MGASLRKRFAWALGLAGMSLAAVFSPPASAELFAATLPGSRSVVVGTDSTIFAVMVNTAATPLNNCRVALGQGAPAGLSMSYRRATPQNLLTGDPPNTPFTIAGTTNQNLVLAFTAGTPFSGRDVALTFACDGATARLAPGVNTVFLTSVATPAADVIPIAVTPTNDGAIRVTTVNGTGFVATAAVNIGPSAFLEVRPDTGDTRLNVGLTICETNPATGACLAPPGGSVTVQFLTNTPRTFTVFATASGATPFLPDVARVRLGFRDAVGAVVGMTSVAFTAPGSGGPASTNPHGIYSGLVNGRPGFMVTYGLPIGNLLFGSGLVGQRETPSDGATLVNNNHLLPMNGTINWSGTYWRDGGDVPSEPVFYSGDLVWESQITGEARRAFGTDALFDYRLVFDPITLASVPDWPAGTYDIIHNGVVIGEASATLGFPPLSGTFTWPGATTSCPLSPMLTSRPGGTTRNVWTSYFSGGVNCARGGSALGYAVVGQNGSVRFEFLLARLDTAGTAIPANQPDFLHLQMVRR